MPTRVATKPWSPSPWTVGESRTLDERTPEAGEGEPRLLGARALARGRGGGGCVILGDERAGGVAGQPGRDDKRSAGALERGAERLGRAAIGGGSGREAARECLLVLERQVDDAVGRRGGGAQLVEVVERPAERLGAGRGERGGRGVGAGEPTTSWPAPMSSATTAEPIQPVAPVTNTRMRTSR
jgi:hypothetical protein